MHTPAHARAHGSTALHLGLTLAFSWSRDQQNRLGQMIIYNPPMIFWGAWNTLSPLLPPVTLKKIMVVAPKDKYDMVDAVGPEVMPAEYGGCGKDLVPMC
jgi:hypothetical protein